LRNELRDLSQSLSKELLDLVNDNYQDFLSLGSTLRGGEDRVEEVRLGLLGFQRDLNSVRANVEQRRRNVAGLIEEKRAMKKQIQICKSLLEIGEQIEDLEASLMINTTTDQNVDGQTQDVSDMSDEEVEDGGISMRRLERHVEQYLILKALVQRHSPEQPYVLSQSDRIARIKLTVSLDVEGALKHSRSVDTNQPDDNAEADILAKLLQVVNE
jgi:conserved oligomeric Golgi complex subunit 2